MSGKVIAFIVHDTVEDIIKIFFAELSLVFVSDSLEDSFLDVGNGILDSVGHGGGSLGLWATTISGNPVFKFYFFVNFSVADFYWA